MSLQASGVAEPFWEEDWDEDALCVVCWEKMSDVIFYPCMHTVRSCTFKNLKFMSIPLVALVTG